MTDILIKEFGENLNFIELAPKYDSYEAYPDKVMLKIIEVARSIIIKKMEEKPRAFWVGKSKSYNY